MSDLKDHNQKKSNLRVVGFGEEVKRVELGCCPFCKDAVKVEDFRDELSRKEFNISGLCQKCQDEMFGV